jgi:hypothetical protein
MIANRLVQPQLLPPLQEVAEPSPGIRNCSDSGRIH